MYRNAVLAYALLLACSVGTSRADVVSLTTNKSTGEEFTIALNTGITAEFSWGSGDSESVLFDGSPTTVTVKDGSLTVTSDESLTLLYLPSDGIETMDLSGAESLKKLICPDNDLTELDLSSNTELVELDCQGNSLSTLSISKCTVLEDLNCAQNELSSLTYSSTAATGLKTIICSDNQVGTIRYYSSMTSLNTLWCQNNEFTSLNLRKSYDLRQLCASSNAISSLTLTNMPNLTDLWIENNELTELDLSSGSGSLVAVSVNDNDLDTIIWDSSCKSSLMYFYAHNNNLFYSSFPTATEQLTGVYVPQTPYYMVETVEVGELIDVAGYLKYDGFGSSYDKSYLLINGSGDTLVSGSSADYLILANTRWRFYSTQEDVTMYVTSSDYDDVTLEVQPFDVVDSTTGIASVFAGDEEGLGVSVSDGLLTVTTGSSARVTVYNLAGQCVVSDNVGGGSHSWSLPAGVYIVNGTKVLIP